MSEDAGPSPAAPAQTRDGANARMAPVQQRTVVVMPTCPSAMRKRPDEAWCIDSFHLIKKLGAGYASTVYLATCRLTGLQVAVKLYHKSKLSELNYFQIGREIRIHGQLEHKNIVQLWAAFEDQYGVYLVSEFAARGDVFSDVEKRGGALSEAECVRSIIHPFLSALEYLHNRAIIHRDIKPENLLLNAHGVLKVADFGLCISLAEERAVTRVGTLDYMAPEVVVCPDKHKPNDNKEMTNLYYTALVDAWAVGVLAYELITGRPPFDKGNKKATVNEILVAEPHIPPSVSGEAAHFMRWALTKDAATRPSVSQLLEHPWVTNHMVLVLPPQRGGVRGMVARTDSFVQPRGFTRPMPPDASADSGAAGSSPAHALEDMVRSMQLAAVQQSGRLLGHSNSMSAADKMRFRDIQFEQSRGEGGSGFGGVRGAGMSGAALNQYLAMQQAVDNSIPKRKSDGCDSALPGSRRGSFAAGHGAYKVSGSGAASPQLSQPARALATGGSQIRMLPNGELTIEGSGGSFIGKPMTREELLASLQQSVQQLPSRQGGFTAAHTLGTPGLSMQQQQQQLLAEQQQLQMAAQRMGLGKSKSFVHADTSQSRSMGPGSSGATAQAAAAAVAAMLSPPLHHGSNPQGMFGSPAMAAGSHRPVPRTPSRLGTSQFTSPVLSSGGGADAQSALLAQAANSAAAELQQELAKMRPASEGLQRSQSFSYRPQPPAVPGSPRHHPYQQHASRLGAHPAGASPLSHASPGCAHPGPLLPVPHAPAALPPACPSPRTLSFTAPISPLAAGVHTIPEELRDAGSSWNTAASAATGNSSVMAGRSVGGAGDVAMDDVFSPTGTDGGADGSADTSPTQGSIKGLFKKMFS